MNLGSNESQVRPRRAFLRGLASLPLIGGAVSLIGDPTAANVAPTRRLLERYVAWLANEHAAAAMEYDRPGVHHVEPYAWPHYRIRTPLLWFPEGHEDIDRSVWTTKPSTRAALVLSAVGCDWRGPYR